jgi:hypothetical protein
MPSGNHELGVTLENFAQTQLPFLSKGQKEATATLGQTLSLRLGEPITIRLIEAVGGAGKSELLKTLRPILEKFGVAVIPDEIKPDDYRTEHNFQGTIIATGRIFGEQGKDDILIPIKGFTHSELEILLRQDISDPDLRKTISRFSIGSLRLAKIMADQSIGLNVKEIKPYIIRQFLSRIAASFLIDRIPNQFIPDSYEEMNQLIQKTIFAQYIPDLDLESESSLISMSLFEISSEGFGRFGKLIDQLGSDPKQNNRVNNPVNLIINYALSGKPRHYYSLEYQQIESDIKSCIRNEEIPKSLSFPLYTYKQSLEIYKKIVIGNIEGIDSVFREPRIFLAAQIPHEGTERDILENCLNFCINRPLSGYLRKTSLAIFPPADRQNQRLSNWISDGDEQFFQKESSGKERHRFFSEPFPDLENLIRTNSGIYDMLGLITGDHSKIPLVPGGITDLILQSILQQLGFPYAIMYINKYNTYFYNPRTQTLNKVR